MTLKGGANQACAACKYQRRKCAPTCTLAPYFPPDQHKMFLNVHKLFGVKKIQKLLRNLHPSQRSEAMKSIIYQANIRDRYPVHGCLEVIEHLKFQIRQYQEELYVVNSMLNMYRNQHDQQPISSNAVPFVDFDPSSHLQLGMAHPTNNVQSYYPFNAPIPEQQHHNPEDTIPASQNHSHSSSCSPYNSSNVDVKESLLESECTQQRDYNDSNNTEETRLVQQSQLLVTQPQELYQDAFQDYDDMHSYFDVVDDRQSYIDCKETYDSSPESSVRGTGKFAEDVGENKLKNSSAFFSLISVN